MGRCGLRSAGPRVALPVPRQQALGEVQAFLRRGQLLAQPAGLDLLRLDVLDQSLEFDGTWALAEMAGPDSERHCKGGMSGRVRRLSRDGGEPHAGHVEDAYHNGDRVPSALA